MTLQSTEPATIERLEARFGSGDTTCAAWHYPGTNGGCVVMAGGKGVTKEPATDGFAPRFQQAGSSALAINFRRLAESGAERPKISRVSEQVAYLEAALACERTLP